MRPSFPLPLAEEGWGAGFRRGSQADLRQLDESAGAVRQPEPERRQAVFLEAGHFAEGPRISVRLERRIVAEAGGTARRPNQRAVRARLDLFEMIVGPRHAQ